MTAIRDIFLVTEDPEVKKNHSSSYNWETYSLVLCENFWKLFRNTVIFYYDNNSQHLLSTVPDIVPREGPLCMKLWFSVCKYKHHGYRD